MLLMLLVAILALSKEKRLKAQKTPKKSKDEKNLGREHFLSMNDLISLVETIVI